MKTKASRRVVALILLTTLLMMSFAAIAVAAPNEAAPSPGAAPNSGDGIPDGSGFGEEAPPFGGPLKAGLADDGGLL